MEIQANKNSLLEKGPRDKITKVAQRKKQYIDNFILKIIIMNFIQ